MADLHLGDNGDKLKRYWTTSAEGLAKWATTAHPFTNLVQHLTKYVGADRAKRIAAQWFHDVFGIWPGERKGSNPAGPG